MPPVTLTAANTTISVKAGDLISDAFREIGVGSQGEALDAEDSNNGLAALQRRVDLVNAQKELIYAINFNLFTAPANTSPIPIGPGATFNVPNVPIKIESASWLLPSGPVDLPVMNMLSDDDYAKVSLKSLTSTLPTALYYSRGASQGSIFLLPIPTVGRQIRLQLWSLLSQAIDLTTAIAMPPAYWMYMMCALASDLAPSYGPDAMAIISGAPFMLKYREARNVIQANGPATSSLASGVPSSGKSVRPDFNYLTGQRGSQ